jgi:hypothetical protein
LDSVDNREALYSLTVVYQDVFGRIHQFTTYKNDQDSLIEKSVHIKTKIANAGNVVFYYRVEYVSESDFALESDFQAEVTNH